MSLKDKLMEDLKQALREGDERRKSAIRLAMAAIRNAEIEKRRELDDGEILQIIAKEVKQRRDSIAEFEKGDRGDLIDQEKAELEVLLAYLPPQMTREEIEEAARRVIQEVGATGLGQMGEVMRRLMPQVKGRADGRLVSEVVRALLTEGA